MIDDSWCTRTDGLTEVLSAGGVVLRGDGDCLLVALITELDHPHYVLPKGHVEPGESLESAARREVGEEAGLHDLRLVRSPISSGLIDGHCSNRSGAYAPKGVSKRSRHKSGNRAGASQRSGGSDRSVRSVRSEPPEPYQLARSAINIPEFLAGPSFLV